MAITTNELTEALQRASFLMSEEGQKQINFAHNANKNSFSNEGDFQRQYVPNTNNYTPRTNNVSNVNRVSKLPKAIQESLQNNPIDNFCDISSVIDNVNLSKNNRTYVTEQQTPVQQYVPLQPQVPQPQYVPQMSIGVDYNYIKSIVSECIKENIKQIKEEILNESTLKAIRVGGENKIQLIDSKNNLYESKLEFKKNLNKK